MEVKRPTRCIICGKIINKMNNNKSNMCSRCSSKKQRYRFNWEKKMLMKEAIKGD